VSEDPEENEEVAIGKKAFTEKLQKFKKSPRKKVPRMRFPLSYVSMTVADSLTDKERKQTDDDSIVPNDASDSDVTSLPSEGDRRSTSRSSVRSASGPVAPHSLPGTR
jgi:hypothetical protein